MKKMILLSIVLLCFVGSSVYGANNEDKMKGVNIKRAQGQDIVLDDKLRKEMSDLLINNENVSVRDLKKLMLAGRASRAILEDLSKRYGATIGDYQAKIKDEQEKRIYRIANKVWNKYQYRAFYTCKNDDQKAAMESMKKVDVIRGRISAILQQDIKKRESDEIIKLEEQILDECRFEYASLSLLTSFRIRGMGEKYNNQMLKIIADDQINYDYLYSAIDEINTPFILHYLEFLRDVNGSTKKLILSKEQVKFIAESLLTKHQEVFNLRNAPYYSAGPQPYSEIFVGQGVESLVNVSTWLREYKLDDLNNKFIERFFKDEMVISTLRDDPWFKDFWNYLLQRPGFEKYRDA